MVHIGKNIATIRMMKQIPQKAMASVLGITQQDYSRIENKETDIEDEMLQRIASELQVPVDAFKETDLENKVQTVFQNNSNDGNVIAIQINPLEKIVELYERMLLSQQKELDEARKRIKELEARF